MASEDETANTLKSEAILNWKLNPELDESELKLNVPESAKKTIDIYAFMLDGLSRQMLGKPHPALSLQTLEGEPWSLESHDGRDVVCLVFWSTVAAPSLPDTEQVRRLIRKFEAEGVQFYLINVGESAERIRSFADSRKLTHPVILDPDLKAAHAYGVTSLPTTLVLSKDGTLQSAHVGHTADILDRIEEDLSQIVAGKTLFSDQN